MCTFVCVFYDFFVCVCTRLCEFMCIAFLTDDHRGQRASAPLQLEL